MSFATNVLKQIVDLFHTETTQYLAEIVALKQKIVDLENENKSLKEVIAKPIKQEPVQVSETILPTEPMIAPTLEELIQKKPPVRKIPRIAPAKVANVTEHAVACEPSVKPVVTSEPAVNDASFAKEAEKPFVPLKKSIIQSQEPQNTNKVVTVNADEKTRKEYIKDYQRAYRERQKEKKQSQVTTITYSI